MPHYALAHLSDAALLRNLEDLVARDRLTTAGLLAHLAEVDARKLYIPAGYSSMHAYCVGALRLSDDAAFRRIRAARAARRFPVLFEAVAEGRLHLAAVSLLAPHIAPNNAGELITAATHRPKYEIETLLARRFGASEPRALVRALTPTRPQLAPERIASDGPGASNTGNELVLGRVGADVAESQLVLGRVDAAQPSVAVAPQTGIAPPPVDGTQPSVDAAQSSVDAGARTAERYLVRVAISKSTHDKLRHAQALLSHALPAGDVAQVLDRALDALIAQLERRKLGAPTSQPPSKPRSNAGPRHIPASVRRTVWRRDQGRCTFTSVNGVRCEERRFLEFDHVQPVARGGKATVESLRLRCRAHNQYEAERVFGAAFMSRKREEARLAAANRRESRPAGSEAERPETRARAPD